MSTQDKDAVIAAFSEAFEKANGKKPDIEAKGGWYSVDGGKNMRLAQLEEMTATLAKGKSDKKAAKSQPAKSAKKPAKTAKKSKKSKGSSDFSVKAFWRDKITAENDGAILPR